MATNLYYANVTVHVLAALFWLGGMFFIALVGAPALRTLEPDVRARIFTLLGVRFRAAGWAAIAILVATGFVNLHFRGILRWQVLGEAAFWSSRYGTTLAWKLAAVTTMLIVSVLHDFVLGPAAAGLEAGSPAARRARIRASWLARSNALLGVIVVIAAVRLARGG